MAIRARLAMAALFTVGSVAAEDANVAIFRDKIQPVLNAHCASCHSGKTPQSQFTVSTFEAVLQGGKHGHAIQPGDSKGSSLVQYLRGEKTPRMPLGGALPAATVDALAAAIDSMKPAPEMAKSAGAHAAWLFKKPVASPAPPVQNKDWIRNPIDAFLLARLEPKGLEPAPAADRRALIRRLYFDLIGLPPTPEEIEEFKAASARATLTRS